MLSRGYPNIDSACEDVVDRAIHSASSMRPEKVGIVEPQNTDWYNRDMSLIPCRGRWSIQTDALASLSPALHTLCSILQRLLILLSPNNL